MQRQLVQQGLVAQCAVLGLALMVPCHRVAGWHLFCGGFSGRVDFTSLESCCCTSNGAALLCVMPNG